MYRKSICLLLVVACLVIVGCGKKDAQINSFVTEINTFTDELVKKVESSPNASDGVDEAQKYMDSRKADLKSKFDSVKNIGENQVSEDTKKKMQDSFYQDGVKVGQLQAKYGS